MNTHKIIVLSLTTNLFWFALLVGVFAFTQTVGAQSPSSPVAANLVGPYYRTYSGADFRSFRDDFSITRDETYGVIRQGTIGIGVAGVQLPPGATITQVLNDSNNVNGPVELRLKSCVIGGTGAGQCTERALASNTNSGRQPVSANLNYATDPANEAYFLELLINNNNSVFYYARIAYSVPAPTFLPIIQR